MLTIEEQLAVDIIQALKAIKKDSRSQPHGRGSSKGTGVTLGVLDESTDTLKTSSEGTGIKQGVPDNVQRSSTAKADEEKKDDDDDDDDGRLHDDEYVQHDMDEDMKDVKDANTGKYDMTDAAKADVEKMEEVKGDEKKYGLPLTSSNLYVSSGFSNQFLAHSSYISLTRTLKDTTDVEINSLLDIQIQSEVPHIQSLSMLVVHVSVILKPLLFSPIPEIPTETHATTPPPPPFVTTSTPKATLFHSMSESKSFNKLPAHKAMYHTLMESMLADEEGLDQGVIDLLKHKKRQHDDQDKDPSARPNQGMKTKRRRNKDSESSNKTSTTKEPYKGKSPVKPSKSGKSVTAKVLVEEPDFEIASDDIEHTIDDVVNNVNQP
ncbi:hypothetical protein Tco_0699679 [Tanacetum coccineum]